MIGKYEQEILNKPLVLELSKYKPSKLIEFTMELSKFLGADDTPQIPSLCLLENLNEFIKNAVDAKAKHLWFSQTTDPTIAIIIVHIWDDGSGFDEDWLHHGADHDQRKNYTSILGDHTHINSTKLKQTNQLGGAGRGLANCSKILNEYNGDLHFYNNSDHGAHIELSAPIQKETAKHIAYHYAILAEKITKQDFQMPTAGNLSNDSPVKKITHLMLPDLNGEQPSQHSVNTLFAKRKAQRATMQQQKNSNSDNNNPSKSTSTNDGSSININNQ